MYIPTVSQLRFIEKDQLKHQRKLDEIQGKDRKAHSVEKQITLGLKVSQTRQNNLKVTKKIKATELEQENELLLGKLVEISRKKSPGFPIRSESVIGFKSLHTPFKKKEMMRIASENETFARRLISQQSTFDRKKLEGDYKKHKDLVTHLKRISTSPIRNFPKRLPPMKSESQTPNVQSSLKQSEVSLKQSELVQAATTRETGRPEVAKLPVNVSVVAGEEPDKNEGLASKRNEQTDTTTGKENKSASVSGINNPESTQEVAGQNRPGNQSHRVEGEELKQKTDNEESNQEKQVVK